MIVTRKEVADRLKVSRTTVCMVLAGKELGYRGGYMRSGVIYNLEDVAKGFNIPLQVLERVMRGEDELLTPDEVSMLAGIGPSSCCKLGKKGLVEMYKILTRTVRFTLSSVLEYLKEHKPERYKVALNYAIYKYGMLVPEEVDVV